MLFSSVEFVLERNMLPLCLLLLFRGVIAVPLADFYPFGLEAGDSLLPRGDDDSSPPILLSQGFTVFGEHFEVAYVSSSC